MVWLWSGCGRYLYPICGGIIEFVCEKKNIVKARGPSEKRSPGQLPRLPCPKFGPDVAIASYSII